jgi:hypothetical protein
LTVREDQHYDPSSLSRNLEPQVSQTPPTPAATLPNKPSPEITNARYRPYSRPQPPTTIGHHEGHRVSQAKPVSGTGRAAEVGTTLGMAVQPKPAPRVRPILSSSVINILILVVGHSAISTFLPENSRIPNCKSKQLSSEAGCYLYFF